MGIHIPARTGRNVVGVVKGINDDNTLLNASIDKITLNQTRLDQDINNILVTIINKSEVLIESIDCTTDKSTLN